MCREGKRNDRFVKVFACMYVCTCMHVYLFCIVCICICICIVCFAYMYVYSIVCVCICICFVCICILCFVFAYYVCPRYLALSYSQTSSPSSLIPPLFLLFMRFLEWLVTSFFRLLFFIYILMLSSSLVVYNDCF